MDDDEILERMLETMAIANDQPLKRLLNSAKENNECKAWNEWKKKYPIGMVNLYKADLMGVNLELADLKHVCLDDANLEGVNFEGADLQGAFLRRSYLKNAKLEKATLDGALLYGAYLES